MKKFQIEIKSLDQQVNDILLVHNSELANLTQESDDSLAIFRLTVQQIGVTNEKIDSSVSRMQSAISGLQNVVNQMNEKKAANEKVSSKIQEFLI